jgi:hypothetical protein
MIPFSLVRPATVAAALALATLGCRPAERRLADLPATPDTSAVMRDIAYLASDRLEGRGTGTPGNDSAATYIAARFAALRLAPASATTCASGTVDQNGCMAGYRQMFTARPMAAMHGGKATTLPTSNVVAVLRGSDPALRDQYVVLGAHYDHLGTSSFGALDPEAAGAIHNGADDNASGTAAVLELARLLRRAPPRRSVAFVLFSGEELGLLGSQHFVEHLPFPLGDVQAMLNFDMVGRLRDDALMVYGVETAAELRGIVERANQAPALRLTAIGDGFGASDHSSFYARNLPVLHFFTNVHEDYHKASDDVERINAAGVARVVSYAERIVRDIADRPERLTFVRGAPASRPTTAARSGSSTYLGSIPDMAAGETAGQRITGVRAGSPADKAGLQAGDVIVELGGKAVKDLYSYTEALYAHKPGETVSIVVVRKGERVTLQATLGTRGG